jgi:tellurite methyltransferase
VQGWEPLWRRDAVAAQWLEPDPSILAVADRLRAAGVRRVYDLGCGVGRHAAALAERGFDVVASDLSPTALLRCRDALGRTGAEASLLEADMRHLALADASVDWVLAYHVLYHATAAEIEVSFREIGRILRPGGYVYATLISTSDTKRLRFEEQVAAGEAVTLERLTFRCPGEDEGDEFLPHHFPSEAELRERFLAGFEIERLREERGSSVGEGGRRRDRAHWHFLARRPNHVGALPAHGRTG